MVGGIGYVGVPGGIAGQGARESELAGFRAEAAPGTEEPELRRELDDAMVDVVGDIDVAGGVEGHAVGEAELSGAAAARADRALEDPVGVEPLDAVVVVVGDDHLAFVRRHAAGIGEVAGAVSVGAPLHRFLALKVEALDAVVAAVSHVDVAGGGRDPATRRLRGVLRGAEVEAPQSAAAPAPAHQECAVGIELLDPVVARVDHVDVAGWVGRDPADRAELAVTATV